MEVFQQLFYGLSVALLPINLLYCFFGVLIGTLVGVLPGVGPASALSILLPVTFFVPPASTMILLAGIAYGAMYGGSTTSILVNIPGEGASVVTCLDGYQMARKGRAGPALGISAFGSLHCWNDKYFFSHLPRTDPCGIRTQVRSSRIFCTYGDGAKHYGLPSPGVHDSRSDYGLLRPDFGNRRA